MDTDTQLKIVDGLLEQGRRSPFERLDAAIRKHNPRYVIALFSGGHDSLVATHIASRHARFSFAGHINTGIGIEKTREFVRQTCKKWGVELREYRAEAYTGPDGKPSPQIYADLVRERGFPGPPMHTKMYNRLKERPLRQMIRELDRNRSERVVLVTGIRATESTRRMAHVKPEQVWEGTKIWLAPIWDFTTRDVNDYLERESLQRNMVVDLLHMSGECLCGAFAHPGEKEEIRMWFPQAAKMLDELENQVRSLGFPWGWGQRPPRSWVRGKKNRRIIGASRGGEIPMLCLSCSNALDSYTLDPKRLLEREVKKGEISQ
jgi:3'-phosphoadenosine 5'-phosphosulfate sulfotransferase (PAPS reductase)/FAD synthetase